MKAWLGPLAAACAIAGAPVATADMQTVSIAFSGSPDAIVAYECDFTDGGNADGRATPPWSGTWPTAGLRCRFEHVVGQRSVTIDLRAKGSRATVSMAGRGSSATLSVGRQPEGGW